MKKLRSRFTFPGLSTEWLYPETATLTHSGGTAPVSHRTSLLGPCGHLRPISMQEAASGLQEHVNLDNNPGACKSGFATSPTNK